MVKTVTDRVSVQQINKANIIFIQKNYEEEKLKYHEEGLLFKFPNSKFNKNERDVFKML